MVISLLILYVLAFVYSHKFHKQRVHQLTKRLVSGDGYQIFSHRGGLLECPENTIEGLEKVIQSKDWFFETDVHFTKDNRLVCVHDRSLKRVTGQDSNCEDLTYDEILPVIDVKITDSLG
jgi:glycerophosphoryl diester phosphodiesterase